VALLGLRAAPKEDSAASAAELVMVSPLILPGLSGQLRYCTCQILHMSTRLHCPHGRHPLQQPAHLARAELVGINAWRPAEAIGDPICQPEQGGGQRAEDFPNPGGPEAGDHFYGAPEGPHWSQPRQRPLLKAALPTRWPLLQSILRQL
jgi:hypothetical protein